MNRDEFESLLQDFIFGWKCSKEIMAEFDRLTAINAQLVEACKWASEQPHHDGCPAQDFHSKCECFLSGVRAAIRAAEEETCQ